jgi:hypothetical protein
MIEETYNTYYYSDPTSADVNMHHLVIQSILKLDGDLPWRWHAEKPDESMVDPVWSNEKNGWVENDSSSKTKIIANLQTKVEAQAKQLEKVNQNQNDTAQSLTTIEQGQKDMQKQQGDMLKLMALLNQKLSKPTDTTNGGATANA